MRFYRGARNEVHDAVGSVLGDESMRRLKLKAAASLPNSKLASDSKRRQMVSTMRQTLRRMNAIVEGRRVRRASVGSVGGAQFHVGGGMQACIEVAAAARAAEANAKAGAAQAHHLPAMLRLRNRCKGNNGSSKSTG